MILFWISGGHVYPEPPDSAPYKQIIDKRIEKIKEILKKNPQKRAYFGLTRNLRNRRTEHRLARGDKKLKLFKIFLCLKGSESFYERYAISNFWNRVGKDKSLNINSGGMGRKPGRKFIYWYVTQETKKIQEHPLGFPYSFVTKYRIIRKLDLSNCVIPVIDMMLGRLSIISLLNLKEHTSSQTDSPCFPMQTMPIFKRQWKSIKKTWKWSRNLHNMWSCISLQ